MNEVLCGPYIFLCQFVNIEIRNHHLHKTSNVYLNAKAIISFFVTKSHRKAVNMNDTICESVCSFIWCYYAKYHVHSLESSARVMYLG